MRDEGRRLVFGVRRRVRDVARSLRRAGCKANLRGHKGLQLAVREIAASEWTAVSVLRGTQVGCIARKLSFRIRLRGVRW